MPSWCGALYASRKEASDAGVCERVSDQVGTVKRMASAVTTRNGHHNRSRGNRCPASVFGVFEDQQLLGSDAMSSCCCLIDLRVWLAVANIGRRENKGQPVKETDPGEYVVGEVWATAGRHTFGNGQLFQPIYQHGGSRHQCEPVVEERVENLFGFCSEGFNRVIEPMPFDHDREGCLLRTAHHCVEELSIKRTASPPQDFSANILVQLFCVDEKPVEIEGDGGKPKGGGHVSGRHQDSGILASHAGGLRRQRSTLRGRNDLSYAGYRM